ncbi:hypothetical protein [Pseudomonas luteola]|uniref:hypothetical protein n=1 Tax=Pseudomonas luteola TaxID=47886 RepID=UPI000F77BA12|nr:hypothetical protein [Pseudomonas luteola]
MAAKRKLRQRTCKACQKAFNPERKDTKFCSAACRQSAYRGRKAATVARRKENLPHDSFAKWLVQNCKRSGTVEVLTPTPDLVALDRLVTSCRKCCGFDGQRVIPAYEIGHICPAAGNSEVVGLLTPANLYVSTRGFNRRMGSTWHEQEGEFLRRSQLNPAWFVDEASSDATVLRKIEEYISEESLTAFLESRGTKWTKRQRLIRYIEKFMLDDFAELAYFDIPLDKAVIDTLTEELLELDLNALSLPALEAYRAEILEIYGQEDYSGRRSTTDVREVLAIECQRLALLDGNRTRKRTLEMLSGVLTPLYDKPWGRRNFTLTDTGLALLHDGLEEAVQHAFHGRYDLATDLLMQLAAEASLRRNTAPSSAFEHMLHGLGRIEQPERVVIATIETSARMPTYVYDGEEPLGDDAPW